MTSVRVGLTDQAWRDYEAARDYYFGEAGLDVALQFVDAFDDAVTFIGERPNAGSPRYAALIAAEYLRHWPVKGFPYLLFYVGAGSEVEVIRVMHAQRDIPAWLRDT